MAISFFGMNLLNNSSIGEVWKPRAQRLMVGRDIAPLTRPEGVEDQKRNVVMAQGDDVSFTASKLFNHAKLNAMSGRNTGNFRSMSIQTQTEALLKTEDGKQLAPGNISLFSNEKYHLALDRSGGTNTLNICEKIKDEDGKEKLRLVEQVKLSGNTRISWGEDGAPRVISGNSALRGGELAAEGRDEILLRFSGVNVKAGENSTVFNFSNEGGNFSGGANTTYLGSYRNSVFENQTGSSNYAGYFADSSFSGGENSLATFSGVFENSDISAGNGDDVFSGYFSASRLNGGNGKNLFSGMFIARCEVNGGDDNDTFNGRFVSSSLKGGKGDDSFGNRLNLNSLSLLRPRNGDSYLGLVADFVDSDIEAGEGNDNFEGYAWSSRLETGAGNDTVKGMFNSSRVEGGEGNDKLTALYSMASSFHTGLGNNSVDLATSIASTVRTDEGENKISLGRTRDEASAGDARNLGGDFLLSKTNWLTPDEMRHARRGVEFGELHSNFVEASKGENQVLINNGESQNGLLTGNITQEVEEQNTGPDAAEAINQQAVRNDQIRNESELLENAAATNESEVANLTKRRKIVGRYALQTGAAPLSEGSLAAVVRTGTENGNLIYHGIDRGPEYEKLADENPVAGLLKGRAQDAYAWAAALS